MGFSIKLGVLGFAAAMLATTIVPAAASAHQMNSTTRQQLPSIVETAIAVNQQSGEFSTLIAALSCTGLINELRLDPDRGYPRYTVFAPTDAAFAKLSVNKDTVCTAVSQADLTNILKYHINRGNKDSSRVLARHQLRMLNHQKAVISGATIDGANIIQTDIKARNGYIHVIDTVMSPES